MHCILSMLTAMSALVAKALVGLTIIWGPCPGTGPYGPGCTGPGWNTVYVGGIGTAGRGALDHELGHQFDYRFLTDQDRGMFLALTHDQRPWRSPPNSPHEQFAEAFSACARSTHWPRSGGYGALYRPSLFEYRKVCRWLTTLVVRPDSSLESGG